MSWLDRAERIQEEKMLEYGNKGIISKIERINNNRREIAKSFKFEDGTSYDFKNRVELEGLIYDKHHLGYNNWFVNSFKFSGFLIRIFVIGEKRATQFNLDRRLILNKYDYKLEKELLEYLGYTPEFYSISKMKIRENDVVMRDGVFQLNSLFIEIELNEYDTIDSFSPAMKERYFMAKSQKQGWGYTKLNFSVVGIKDEDEAINEVYVIVP